jgi:SRSO17 transposase
MLPLQNPYNVDFQAIGLLEELTSDEILEGFQDYVGRYENSFAYSEQENYFTTFLKGLLSNLDRKSIEPIALAFLDAGSVRGFQQFFTRSHMWENALRLCYKKNLSNELTDRTGFLSVDESDFVKKGKHSVGVARQHCGRLGKQENCQAGVFLSYASEKGIGLLDSHLYLPEQWFSDEYEELRKECHIPSEITFQTKNEIAKRMIRDVITSNLFEIECIGCDASFGSDHTFLDELEEGVHYFASVRENENIFREMPQVVIPANPSGKRGGRFKHPRATEKPVAIKCILDDETVPWMKRTIAEGAKGPVIAEIKCVRCISSRKENRLFVPKSEIWVYIRKHEDGKIKYFISNYPSETPISKLDRLATARWSIEQCFQECKSYLGMTHYETRSYQAWHKHMLLVMIAHLFVTIMRNNLKKKTYISPCR